LIDEAEEEEGDADALANDSAEEPVRTSTPVAEPLLSSPSAIMLLLLSFMLTRSKAGGVETRRMEEEGDVDVVFFSAVVPSTTTSPSRSCPSTSLWVADGNVISTILLWSS